MLHDITTLLSISHIIYAILYTFLVYIVVSDDIILLYILYLPDFGATMMGLLY